MYILIHVFIYIILMLLGYIVIFGRLQSLS